MVRKPKKAPSSRTIGLIKTEAAKFTVRHIRGVFTDFLSKDWGELEFIAKTASKLRDMRAIDVLVLRTILAAGKKADIKRIEFLLQRAGVAMWEDEATKNQELDDILNNIDPKNVINIMKELKVGAK